MCDEMKEGLIHTEYITLGQAMKLCGEAQSGIDTLNNILDKDSNVVGAMQTAINNVQDTIDNLPELQKNLQAAELAVSNDSQANITAYNHNKDVVEKADQNVKDAK